MKLHALIPRRKKAAAPQPVIQRLVARCTERNHDDESGQVLVLAAQTVSDPRTQTRTSCQLKTGERKRDGGIVIDLLRVHGLDEAEIVRNLRGVRQQLAQGRARLSVLSKLVNRRSGREAGLERRHPCQPLSAPHGIRQILAAKFLELRLVIEELQLRWAAGLEQIDHTLRFRCEMRQVWQA